MSRLKIFHEDAVRFADSACNYVTFAAATALMTVMLAKDVSHKAWPLMRAGIDNTLHQPADPNASQPIINAWAGQVVNAADISR